MGRFRKREPGRGGSVLYIYVMRDVRRAAASQGSANPPLGMNSTTSLSRSLVTSNFRSGGIYAPRGLYSILLSSSPNNPLLCPSS